VAIPKDASKGERGCLNWFNFVRLNDMDALMKIVRKGSHGATVVMGTGAAAAGDDDEAD